MGRAVVAYVAIIAYVRVSGNRTLAKLRAFDLVITIALGSVFASTVVVSAVPLWQGLLAMAALIALQWLAAKLSVHSRLAERALTNEPALLFRDGRWNDPSLRRARITRGEVESAMRGAGHASPASVDVAWLEVNGTISVVPHRSRPDA